jgi:hypothetical protein
MAEIITGVKWGSGTWVANNLPPPQWLIDRIGGDVRHCGPTVYLLCCSTCISSWRNCGTAPCDAPTRIWYPLWSEKWGLNQETIARLYQTAAARLDRVQRLQQQEEKDAARELQRKIEREQRRKRWTHNKEVHRQEVPTLVMGKPAVIAATEQELKRLNELDEILLDLDDEWDSKTLTRTVQQFFK